MMVYRPFFINYMCYSKEKAFTLIYYTKRLLELNQTFLAAAVTFFNKSAKMLDFSLMQTA